MKRMRHTLFAALLVTGLAFAQGMPISTDGMDPKTWDPKLDAIIAGVKNHVVIFENVDIRVLSVTVQPGEVEVAHHHQWPSVIVFDKPTKRENRDAKGNLLAVKKPPGDKPELPLVLRVPPEAAHSVEPRHGADAPHPRRVQEGLPEGIVSAPRRPVRPRSSRPR